MIILVLMIFAMNNFLLVTMHSQEKVYNSFDLVNFILNSKGFIVSIALDELVVSLSEKSLLNERNEDGDGGVIIDF